MTSEARLVTREQLAAALESTPVPLMNYRTYEDAAAAIFAALLAAAPASASAEADGSAEGLREALVEKARLVSQWHGAMSSGPPEVLDAELGELRDAVNAYLAAPPDGLVEAHHRFVVPDCDWCSAVRESVDADAALARHESAGEAE
jgi:hypothetical protein